MEIHLNSELEDYISSKLKQGYTTPSEFVNNALSALKSHEEVQQLILKQKIQEGINSLDQDGGEDGEIVMAELLQEIKDNYA